ncbi:hypothetical protein A2415_04360 [candidate division WWE3 bacterium RIFOXYC1_FULL_39_7]|uniref:histidine kinase n=1 Tax=candidate division WWE3 bacterium RIFOXYC1_FULL_39_7 TaxID=1802643 RepID=A0A1F4WLW6_UNCKA|nr:MAG: hypothetical protein A2415_04360 [candidate division WWE3 bacterium RIFOXYC1_FULL_39_7]
MIVYTFLFGFTLILNLFLALFVLLKSPKNQINISFSFFVFTVVAWMSVNYLSNQNFSYETAFIFNKLIFVISPYISYALLFFAFAFPTKINRFSRKYLVFLLIPVLVSNVLTFFNLVIKDITFIPGGGTGVIFGMGIVFFGAQFVTYLLWSIALLVKKYLRSSGAEKVRLQYLLAGVVILTVVGTVTNFIVPLLFNNFVMSNIGPILSFFVFAFTAYAIVQHELFDIKVIATQILTVLICLVLFAKVMVSQSGVELMVNALILGIVVIFGIFLVRSVVKEVDQRRELERLTKKLKETDTMKNEFISVAAHELRAPLTAVKGYTSMIIEGDTGPISDKAKEFLQDTLVSTARMIRLVNNMLDVGRIEEGRIIYQEGFCNVSEIVKQAFGEFKLEAEHKNIEYKIDIPDGVHASVYVDKDRLHEVVVNFLSNALKYTDAGSVMVKMTNPSLDRVKVEVIDTGRGITSKEQKKLFRKFYRVKSNIGKTIGSGLGLYISKLLIEKFGGEIGVVSQAGRGSNFWFVLPRRENDGSLDERTDGEKGN